MSVDLVDPGTEVEEGVEEGDKFCGEGELALLGLPAEGADKERSHPLGDLSDGRQTVVETGDGAGPLMSFEVHLVVLPKRDLGEIAETGVGERNKQGMLEIDFPQQGIALRLAGSEIKQGIAGEGSESGFKGGIGKGEQRGGACFNGPSHLVRDALAQGSADDDQSSGLEKVVEEGLVRRVDIDGHHVSTGLLKGLPQIIEGLSGVALARCPEKQDLAFAGSERYAPGQIVEGVIIAHELEEVGTKPGRGFGNVNDPGFSGRQVDFGGGNHVR